MWVDRKLVPLCGCEILPHPWPWSWILKVKFWKSCISGMGESIAMERKWGWVYSILTYYVTWPWFLRSNFEKARNGWPIDMMRKGCVQLWPHHSYWLSPSIFLWWRHEMESFSALLALSACHRWIPLTKASNAELWCFLWSAPEQTLEKTIETPVIRDAITLIMTLM